MLSRKIAASATAAALAILASVTPAYAVEVESRGPECPPNDHIEITSSHSTHIPASSNYFKDGPGGSMTVSVTTASTVTATATLTAGVTIESVVAAAKMEVSGSIAKSTAITLGHSYTRNISPGMYGNMQYGAYGYSVNWQKVRVYSNCSYTILGTGTAQLPNNGGEGWRFWETYS